MLTNSNDLANSNDAQSAQAVWRNWSGAQQARPAAILMPRDEDELRRQVSAADHMRVVGAGHSFTALVPTSGAIVSLDRLSGLIRHDAHTQQARVWAGTRLFDLGPLLHGIDQAMPNLGDINRQSLAGALGTATHGTGLNLPCIAAGATALRLVTAAGDVLECSREHEADLFHAAAVSLGMLGIVTQVTLQNVPVFRLRERIYTQSLDSLLPEIDALSRRHRNFELFVFPASRQAVVKVMDVTEQLPSEAMEDGISDDLILKWGCELTYQVPLLGRALQSLIGHVIRPTERVDWSHLIYPSARNVRFNEMEYQVPAESGADCLDEVCRAMADSGVNAFFPVEFRRVAADDYWLSPFQSQPGQLQSSAGRWSISVHQYHKQDYRPLFEAAEPVLRRHGGRPHWGKLHTTNAAQLRELYPDLERFLRLRAELDPHGKFLNPYLQQLFAIATP